METNPLSSYDPLKAKGFESSKEDPDYKSAELLRNEILKSEDINISSQREYLVLPSNNPHEEALNLLFSLNTEPVAVAQSMLALCHSFKERGNISLDIAAAGKNGDFMVKIVQAATLRSKAMAVVTLLEERSNILLSDQDKSKLQELRDEAQSLISDLFSKEKSLIKESGKG